MSFFEVYMFSQLNFSWSMGQFFGSAVTHTLQKSEELPLGCLFDVFIGIWLSIPAFCIKGYDCVKRFVRVLVLSVINTGSPKTCQKQWGTLHCCFPVQTMLKAICVLRRRLVFPVFSKFSETPCYEGWI